MDWALLADSHLAAFGINVAEADIPFTAPTTMIGHEAAMKLPMNAFS